MTEPKAHALDLTEPRLAPLRRDNLPSFVVDVSTATVLAATAASARLGITAELLVPPRIRDAAQAIADGRAHPSPLVRLRLPRSLTPRLFRALAIDGTDGTLVLFADPDALAFEPAIAVEAHVSPRPATAPEPVTPRGPTSRFTFETDAQDRLRGFSPALAEALGSQAYSWIGASFQDLELAGRIVSAHAICHALAQGTSFSGVQVTVPGTTTLELELGGVPLHDQGRRRIATRGFGVMRRWTGTPMPPPATIYPMPSASMEPPATAGAMDRDLEQALARSAGRSAARTMGEELTNILPFNGLTPRESNYFEEIGRTLEAAMRTEGPASASGAAASPEPAGQPLHILDVLDALPLGTLLQDGDELAHVNRTLLDWTGWPDTEAVRAAGGAAHLLRRDADGEQVVLSADGALLPVDDTDIAADFYASGARLHMLQQRAEAQPAASESRREGLHLVPWPVLLVDEDYRIAFANHAAEAQLGFTADELQDQPITTIFALDSRAEAISWLDHATQGAALAAGVENACPLQVRPLDGPEFPTLAALTPVGGESGQICIVLGPFSPSEVEPDAPDVAEAPDSAPASAPAPLATVIAEADSSAQSAPLMAQTAELPRATTTEDFTPALHIVARRLVESLDPFFDTLAHLPEDAAEPLAEPVRDALTRVRSCLGDLGALAEPLAETAPTLTATRPLVEEVLVFARPVARRRHLTLRPDLDDVPAVLTRPAPFARIVRLMLEDALDAAPAGTAIAVSLLCDGDDPYAPIVLQVSDAGPAVDEVELAAASAPERPSAASDRFSRAGRPLRYARLEEEAKAMGAVYQLARGLSRGMTSRLVLPRNRSEN